jgi:hypothetical protein
VEDGCSVGFTNSSGRLSQNQLLAEREKNFTLTSDVALFKMDSKLPAALWIPWKTTAKKNADTTQQLKSRYQSTSKTRSGESLDVVVQGGHLRRDVGNVGLDLGDRPLKRGSDASREQGERKNQARELDHISMDGLFPLVSERIL